MVWESEVYAYHLKANSFQKAMFKNFQKVNSWKIFQFGHPRIDGRFRELGFNIFGNDTS